MGCKHLEVVTETGPGVNDRRWKINRILADPTVNVIIVEHRDRLARMNVGLAESALKAQARRLVVVDGTEMEDVLVRDMTESLTSFRARLYGRWGARNKAREALRAARDA